MEIKEGVEFMRAIYVGDARDVVKRILTNHCGGNVEGSALRKAVAESMGYRLRRMRRPSGSIRVRIDLPDHRVGERRVSEYIRSGMWRYVICCTYEEAHDFQWYVIERLEPLLNKSVIPWNSGRTQRYEALLSQLIETRVLSYHQLRGKQTGSGVYVLYHTDGPM